MRQYIQTLKTLGIKPAGDLAAAPTSFFEEPILTAARSPAPAVEDCQALNRTDKDLYCVQETANKKTTTFPGQRQRRDHVQENPRQIYSNKAFAELQL
jgi:hypothetical protein